MKNKTRKLLGRFTVALIILALSISLFSCVKTPAEDNAVVDSLKTDDTVPPENTPDINAEPNTEAAQNDNNEKTEEIEKPDEHSAASDEKTEIHDPMAFTVNDKFSAYEVAVVLTDEESAKNKEYTIADFDGYDISSIIDYNCYPEQYYPEHKGRRSFVLLLNEPSKARVLEYCEKLSKDSRVQLAEPNVYGYYQDIMYVTLSTEGIENYDEITTEWFSEINLEHIYLGTGVKGDIFLALNECDEESYYKQLKKLYSNKYVKSVRPFYYVDFAENRIDVYITHERYAENPVFTQADFPEANFKFISKPVELETDFCDYTKKVPVYCKLTLILDKCTKKIYKIEESLRNNPIVMYTYLEVPAFTYDVLYS